MIENKKCPNCNILLIKRPKARLIKDSLGCTFTTASVHDYWCPKCNYSTEEIKEKIKY